jgi:hypothetical protein
MNTEARAHLKRLLEGQRVLSLSVAIDGEPGIGLLPFAVLPDHTGVVVHVSSLASHAKGLAEGKTAAILIHQSEEAVSDPLQVPRVSMRADVMECRRGTAEYDLGRAIYLSRFPDAAVTFELADFRLFELRFVCGRYVEGFAFVVDIAPEDLRTMEPPEQPKTNQPPKRRLWTIPRE